MRSAAILGLFWLLLGATAHAQEQDISRLGDGWSRYGNARFGTVLDVPTSLFAAIDPPPENGDGRTFRAKDGAEIRVFGSYGATSVTEDFAGYKAWSLQQAREGGLTVTYTAQGKDWLAFSGSKGDSIVYARLVERCDATHEMRITYPTAQKAVYDAIIGRMSRSLKCRPVE
jgi:hypothetical protein